MEKWKNVNILYEDNHLLVVVKPANMPVCLDESNDIDLLTTLKSYLKEKYQKPGNVYLGLVHRLDRPVSGVMVFAKTSKAAERLTNQIKNHQFNKTYYATVMGSIKEKDTLTDYLIKNNSIMAKHLHIPLQSGSNEILSLMNRKYKKEYFIDRIDYIRKEIPDISITTDLIVGFPNETEEYFEETIDTLKKIKFSKIHTFPYSKRNGTVAATMPNQVDGNVKKCRVKEVLMLSNCYEEEFYKSKIGNNYDGIVEDRKDGKKVVVTSNYIPVVIDDKEVLANTIVDVKIKEVKNGIVFGEVI